MAQYPRWNPFPNLDSGGYNIPQQSGWGTGGGYTGQGGGGGYGEGSWYPELFKNLMGRLGRGQQDWLSGLQGYGRGLIGQATGDLGRSLGSHMSRSNVAFPAGYDVLASRAMSPLSQNMENLMESYAMNQPNYMQQIQNALGLTEQMKPQVEEYMKGQPSYGVDPGDLIRRYIERFLGEQNNKGRW